MSLSCGYAGWKPQLFLGGLLVRNYNDSSSTNEVRAGSAVCLVSRLLQCSGAPRNRRLSKGSTAFV
jgi:hypothetical protein